VTEPRAGVVRAAVRGMLEKDFSLLYRDFDKITKRRQGKEK
jgi:hypothetical protein